MVLVFICIRLNFGRARSPWSQEGMRRGGERPPQTLPASPDAPEPARVQRQVGAIYLGTEMLSGTPAMECLPPAECAVRSLYSCPESESQAFTFPFTNFLPRGRFYSSLIRRRKKEVLLSVLLPDSGAGEVAGAVPYRAFCQAPGCCPFPYLVAISPTYFY